MDYEKKVFCVNFRLKIIWFIFITVGIACLNYFYSKELDFIFMMIIITIMLIYVMTNRVVSILIDKSNDSITFKRRKIFKDVYLTLPLRECNIVYSMSTGARGARRYTLKAFKGNIKILEILPGITGWSDKKLQQIVEFIQN